MIYDEFEATIGTEGRSYDFSEFVDGMNVTEHGYFR